MGLHAVAESTEIPPDPYRMQIRYIATEVGLHATALYKPWPLAVVYAMLICYYKQTVYS